MSAISNYQMKQLKKKQAFERKQKRLNEQIRKKVEMQIEQTRLEL